MSEDGEAVAKSQRVRRLEEDGEIAADYLEELLDIADIGGDIDIDVEHGRAVVAVVADEAESGELERLVGADGEVLDALQELTRLAVQTRSGERSGLMLDVAGFREQRKAVLRQQAAEIVAEVRSTGQEVALEPMNAFERKVIHDAVADAGLVSESSGTGADRFVVVRQQ
ncbi:MAG: single-stranded DNA-binding protein [Bifidobacteriaceae bacterium]|jgi:spoIIIJ-associated protein|nr:single-stranded DNA-binding protein [Bifidobacteriaceae bacterium]